MASEVATEVLEDVIQGVLQGYEFVVLLRVKSRQVASLTLTSAISTQGIQLHDVIEFPVGTETVSLLHPKVIKQFVGNLCGYHSLYNVLESARYLGLKSPHRLWKVASAANFWKFHFRTTAFLAKECTRRGNTHNWTVKQALHGDLERNFMKYLLHNNTHILKHFQHNENFQSEMCDFLFQFNEIKMNAEAVLNLQESIDRFRASKQEHLLGFMMGITNHWVALVAHKIGPFREFVFLDSRNVGYLRFTDEEIQRHYETFAAERILLGKKPMTEFDLYVARQGVKDIQKAVHILMDCLLGQKSLPQIIISDKFDYLLNNFYETQGDSALAKIETFLKSGFPPKSIHDEYIVPLYQYPLIGLTEEWTVRLKDWIEFCESALDSPQRSARAGQFLDLCIRKLRSRLLTCPKV